MNDQLFVALAISVSFNVIFALGLMIWLVMGRAEQSDDEHIEKTDLQTEKLRDR